MFPVVYETAKWIGLVEKRFIFSHVLNRRLNPEEHSHEFFEIIFLFSGTAEHRVGGTVKHLEAGDITFLRPGDTHVFIGQSEAIELYSISVVSDEILRFLKTYHLEAQLIYVQDPVVFTLNPSQLAGMLMLFRKLEFSPSQQERDSLMRVILGTMMQDFLLLSLEQERNWFENIMLRMKQPINMAEGVTAMMRIANLSHAQLCRVMKKHKLQTPVSYVKEIRLSTAHELIQNTAMSFEDIALKVGYSSLSHFSSAFKARYGITPGVLRKNSEKYLL